MSCGMLKSEQSKSVSFKWKSVFLNECKFWLKRGIVCWAVSCYITGVDTDTLEYEENDEEIVEFLLKVEEVVVEE